MNLEKIKCFVDIVKYNSFTKAAQENYITQAAISQQIASMEAELGFPLFVRSKRGFTVTDSGKSFYESSLRLLALYSRSLSRARCIAHNLSGYISLGIWPGLDTTHTYCVIQRLLQAYPSMQITIRPGAPTELFHKYTVGKLAMAIAMPYDFSDNTISDAVIEPLLTCGWRLFVSRDHPLAQFDAVDIADIRNEKFAVQGEESIGFQTYNLTVTEQMLIHHALSPAFVVPNFDTQQMLVATNQAVMLLPECCHPTVPALFQSIRLTGYPETCTFSAIWRSHSASPVLLAYAALLKEYFAARSAGACAFPPLDAASFPACFGENARAEA